ncbi:MAG: ABC transporter substrate-binding protein [Alphaproteobacteria bacterium HGW-Alphaproteobacteria-2]|nr:MAG: ABC transporter substrate-binding protein [Alphaproteobacteria bacterium HGW-Alphaproteobacteria-2]
MKRLAILAAALLAALPAAAGEVRLRAVSAFVFGTVGTRAFEPFVAWVNENGRGVVQIDVIGGPEAMPPFEAGNAVSTGVVDIANVTSAFYTRLLPWADALHLATNTVQEQRANGCFALMDARHQSEMNVKLLARTGDHVPFHLYLTKPISGADLTGLTIRTTPVYRAMFEALGATLVQTAPGEVYAALERGAIDGYGWPLQGVLDLGWEAHTKYRVDPGFYQMDVNFLINLDTWNALDDAQRALLEAGARHAEALNARNIEINAEERRKQAAAGIETIALEGADAALWVETAQREGWKVVHTADPALAEALAPCLGG